MSNIEDQQLNNKNQENQQHQDNHEYMKATRFSQLDDEYAAKLYEDRFRQIQSDMMKKLQLKKSHQKKLLTNPRSSSSLGTYGAQQQQQQLQGQQNQQQFQQNGQLSTKNQNQKSQILSKFNQNASQQIGYMHQSTTTLNPGSRLSTEHNDNNNNNQQNNNTNFSNNINNKPKQKLQTQRSCEFININTNQSPSHALSVDDNNEIIFLNQGFSSPQTNYLQKQHYLKQGGTKNDNNNTDKNSYLKQNKFNNNQIMSQTQPSQRPFLSPPNKRTQQQNQQQQQTQQQIQQLKNNAQQIITRLEMSPSGRATTSQGMNAMTSQGFYSPQANHYNKNIQNKFMNGASTVTNRRNQNGHEQSKHFSERKKVIDISSTQGDQNLTSAKYLNGSSANNNNGVVNNVNNNNNVNSNASSYLVIQSNLKSSLNAQVINQISPNPNNINNNYSQVQIKNNNNNNNQKRNDSTNINTNNNNVAKLNEIEELDLRIQTIEKEIERDNELQAIQQQSSNASKKHSTVINMNKDQLRITQNKLYQNSPSHHVSTDVGIISTSSGYGQNSGTNRHSTYEKSSSQTTTHKQSQQLLNIYSPKQIHLSPDNNNNGQGRKMQLLQTADTAETISPQSRITYVQSAKNQGKIPYEFNKLNVPLNQQSDNQALQSYENSSYNNTPRSINPIHDFRPFSKQQQQQQLLQQQQQNKKQVNFKSDQRVNTQDSQDDKNNKFQPSSPSYQKNYLMNSPLNISVPVNLGGFTPNDLNMKNQLNNQIQQSITQNNNNSRRGQQTSSNPPTMTRLQNNNNNINYNQLNNNNYHMHYNITNQGSTQSLKFQKKLISGSHQIYSQQSNSNLQYNNSQLGTEEDDHEMSEFEYFEKIVNAKNTETSSLGATDDASIQNDIQSNKSSNKNNQNNNNQQSQQQQHVIKKPVRVTIQNSNREKQNNNNGIKQSKQQQNGRNQPNSNRESTNIQQQIIQQQSISVDTSPLLFPSSTTNQQQYSNSNKNFININKSNATLKKLNKELGKNTPSSLRQSDCTPSIHSNYTNNNNNNRNNLESPQISAFQASNNHSKSQPKLKLKTLENNFVNTENNNNEMKPIINLKQSPPLTNYNLYSITNSSNNNNNNIYSSQPDYQNQINSSNQQFYPTSETFLSPTHKPSSIQSKMNRSSEIIMKNNNNNNSNISNPNNNNATPSASSNNISTLSITPQQQQQYTLISQQQQQNSSLNKGQHIQMTNKQKQLNNPNIIMTHTLDTFKNKADIKIKTEQISKIPNDTIQCIRSENPKKSSMKQARFEDEKEDYQLEQMSKNLHKKLNLLLETANQCNENIKSYRINQNN